MEAISSAFPPASVSQPSSHPHPLQSPATGELLIHSADSSSSKKNMLEYHKYPPLFETEIFLDSDKALRDSFTQLKFRLTFTSQQLVTLP